MPGASPIIRLASWWHASRNAAVNGRPAPASIEAGAAAPLLGCLGRLDRHAQFREPAAGLGVEQPIPALGAEAALERGERDLLGGGGDAIANPGEVGERGGMPDHPDPAAAAARQPRRRRWPQSDAGARKARPV